MSRRTFPSKIQAAGLVLALLAALLFLALLVRPTSAAGPHHPLSSAAASFLGEGDNDLAGASVAIIGDVNADGFADIAVGAPNNNAGGSLRGAAYLILGDSTGFGTTTHLWDSQIFKFSGEADGDSAGYSVAGAGDVNGDGYDDFLVGAPYHRPVEDTDGAVYLVLGRPTWSSMTLIAGPTIIKFTGAGAEQAGTSVDGAGDVNRDGFDDVIIGAPLYSPGGAAYVIWGSAGISSTVLAETPLINRYGGVLATDRAGTSVAGVGDVDGDGYDDVLIGAPLQPGGGSQRGVVYLVSPQYFPFGGLLDSPSNVQFFGESDGAQTGNAVAAAGDVNGDGYADMLIGASQYGASQNGAAYIVMGETSPISSTLVFPNLVQSRPYYGVTAGDWLGSSVAGGGDVDGDGLADFLLGAMRFSPIGTSRGTVYALPGTGQPFYFPLNDPDQEFVRYEGFANGGLAGASAGGGGDVNGDGLADYVIGAPGFSEFGTNRGAAFLILSDPPPAGHGPMRQHRRLVLQNTDPATVDFEQSGVWIETSGPASLGGEYWVERHFYHPCNSSKRLAMPIWTVEGSKPGQSFPGSDISLGFKYNDDQVTGMNEASLLLWYRPIDGHCSAWTVMGTAVVHPVTNTVTLPGIGQVHGQFTLAESAPNGSASAASTMPGAVSLPAIAALLPAAAAVFLLPTLRRRRRAN